MTTTTELNRFTPEEKVKDSAAASLSDCTSCIIKIMQQSQQLTALGILQVMIGIADALIRGGIADSAVLCAAAIR
jgi:hypothetical protein